MYNSIHKHMHVYTEIHISILKLPAWNGSMLPSTFFYNNSLLEKIFYVGKIICK